MHTEPQNSWPAIESAARDLGVSDEAIRKWKERGSVPGKWHLAIIQRSKGAVPPSALSRAPALGAAS